MKKLLSTALSLCMLFSAFSAIPQTVSAAETTIPGTVNTYDDVGVTYTTTGSFGTTWVGDATTATASIPKLTMRNTIIANDIFDNDDNLTWAAHFGPTQNGVKYLNENYSSYDKGNVLKIYDSNSENLGLFTPQPNQSYTIKFDYWSQIDPEWNKDQYLQLMQAEFNDDGDAAYNYYSDNVLASLVRISSTTTGWTTVETTFETGATVTPLYISAMTWDNEWWPAEISIYVDNIVIEAKQYYGTKGEVWKGSSDVATAYAGGTGTETDPYIIETAAQFYRAANYSDGGGLSYKLAADIKLNDVSDFDNWTASTSGLNTWPINKKFTGKIDGDGYTVYGLYTISTWNWQHVGLFGRVGDGTVIKNLNLRNAFVYNNYAGAYAGGFIGSVDGTPSVVISGCSIDNSKITGKAVSGADASSNNQSGAGGFVGCMQFNIDLNNCYAGADLILDGTDMWNNKKQGGFGGNVWSQGGLKRTITNCYSMYQDPFSQGKSIFTAENTYKIVADEAQADPESTFWPAVTTVSFGEAGKDFWYQADTTKGLPRLKSNEKFFTYADIDGDGIDDEYAAEDLVTLTKAILEIEENKYAAIDVNRDGTEDVRDLISLKKKL